MSAGLQAASLTNLEHLLTTSSSSLLLEDIPGMMRRYLLLFQGEVDFNPSDSGVGTRVAVTGSAAAVYFRTNLSPLCQSCCRCCCTCRVCHLYAVVPKKMTCLRCPYCISHQEVPFRKIIRSHHWQFQRSQLGKWYSHLSHQGNGAEANACGGWFLFPSYNRWVSITHTHRPIIVALTQFICRKRSCRPQNDQCV